LVMVKGQNNELTHKTTQLREENNRLQGDIVGFRKEKASLVGVKDELAKKVQQLNTELGVASRMAKMFESEKIKAHNEVTQLQAQFAEVSRGKEHHAQLLARINELQERLKKFQTQYDSVTTQNARSLQEVASLKQQIKLLKVSNNKMSISMKEAEEKVRILQAEKEGGRTIMTRARSRLQTRSSAVNTGDSSKDSIVTDGAAQSRIPDRTPKTRAAKVKALNNSGVSSVISKTVNVAAGQVATVETDAPTTSAGLGKKRGAAASTKNGKKAPKLQAVKEESAEIIVLSP